MLEKTLLPVVKRGLVHLDKLLLEFAGPIAAELSLEAYRKWQTSGRTRPSDMRYYAEILAANIDDSNRRKLFMTRANSVLMGLQTGFLAAV